MSAQNIIAEVILEITPNSVDMIGLILCIVVFEQECRALHTVVVSFPRLNRTRPSETDLIHSGCFNFLPIFRKRFIASFDK